MPTYITPDYIFNLVNQKEGETRREYLERLSSMSLNETLDWSIRSAANKRFQYEISHE